MEEPTVKVNDIDISHLSTKTTGETRGTSAKIPSVDEHCPFIPRVYCWQSQHEASTDENPLNVTYRAENTASSHTIVGPTTSRGVKQYTSLALSSLWEEKQPDQPNDTE